MRVSLQRHHVQRLHHRCVLRTRSYLRYQEHGWVHRHSKHHGMLCPPTTLCSLLLPHHQILKILRRVCLLIQKEKSSKRLRNRKRLLYYDLPKMV
jgi:hypothetical protein